MSNVVFSVSDIDLSIFNDKIDNIIRHIENSGGQITIFVNGALYYER